MRRRQRVRTRCRVTRNWCVFVTGPVCQVDFYRSYTVLSGFQDAILSQLGSMSNRIDNLEAKGSGGPVLNQQPLQLPYNQFSQPYGFMSQMSMPPPPPGFGPGQTHPVLPQIAAMGQQAATVPTPPYSGKGGDTSKDTVSPVFVFVYTVFFAFRFCAVTQHVVCVGHCWRG